MARASAVVGLGRAPGEPIVMTIFCVLLLLWSAACIGGLLADEGVWVSSNYLALNTLLALLGAFALAVSVLVGRG